MSGGVLGVVGSLLVPLVIPVAAGTAVVTFDDLPPETTVSNQYAGSHGISFAGPAQGDGFLPVVKAVAAGIAHSGTQVADISTCPGCEFYTPRTVGRLNTTVSGVSAFVGFLGPTGGSASAQVRLTAFDATGQSVGTSVVTVAQGQPFDQLVSVTSASATPTIASFELTAEPPNSSQPVGFDDLTLTTPEEGPPPDFALSVDTDPQVQGPSVDVPVQVTRLNGSDGPITLSASGLPAGLTATFIPNPVTGTGSASTLRLSVAADADPTAGQVITITGVPGAGAGGTPRSVTAQVRIVAACEGSEVRVGGPPDGPVPQIRVFSAAELNDVLRSEFTGRIVIPADAEWEMKDCDGSWLREIPLRSGISLVGERGELGSRPLLFTELEPNAGTGTVALFELTGNDVMVEGLHLRGPWAASEHKRAAKPYIHGIRVIENAEAQLGRRVLIADNEFDRWGGGAVHLVGSHGETSLRDWDPTWIHLEPRDADLVRVERNYMHHNVMDDGGYGVMVGGGAYGTIVGNVFDFNRHAVAGTGRAYQGYIAKYNFVLQGGLRQHANNAPDYYNQHFDVHGEGSGGYGGLAGEYFEIEFNTIRGEQTYYAGTATRPAFMLRGKARNAALFRANVVVHDSLDEAVSLKPGKIPRIGDLGGKLNFKARANRFDTDYSTEVASGDFDGDGRSDVFVANGTAWFFSRAGVRPWEFLRPSSLRTHDLAFADIDNDGVTDVLTRDAGGRLRFFGGGRGASEHLTTLPVSIRDLRTGDFDGDDLTDLFYTRNEQWHIWYGSTGAWSEAQTSVTPIREMLFGEFNEVRGTDVVAVRSGAWSYSSGGIQPWARLNDRLVGSFRDAVAADLDGNGLSDIAFIKGSTWRYSRDGRTGLTAIRNGGPTLDPLLVGHFVPIEGGPSRAQVAGWIREVAVDVAGGKASYRHGLRLFVWRGLGTGNGVARLSAQNMR